MQFLDHGVIGNSEKVEELRENIIYLLENLNFLPDENSYVEPWIERSIEQPQITEEVVDGTDENSKQKTGDRNKKPADNKKKVEEMKKAAESLEESKEKQSAQLTAEIRAKQEAEK